MKKILILIFIFSTIISNSQSNKSLSEKEFTHKWENDSLGKLNFRNSNIAFNKTMQTILINGIDIRGFSEDRVISFLQKPNESGIHKENKLLIISYITKYYESKQSDEILIYFDEKNKVNAVIKKEDRFDLFFKK